MEDEDEVVVALREAQQWLLDDMQRFVGQRLLREKASAALMRGDIPACQDTLQQISRGGEPLLCFQAPCDAWNVAAWRAVLDHVTTALEELCRHNNAMRYRLQQHLQDPRPMDAAWRRSVARTLFLQQRHAQRCRAALRVQEASWQAMQA